MARSNLRLVAGGGVVAAFLLIGDPAAAVAFADRGGSGSQSTHSGSGRSSDHGGNGDKRQGPKQGAGDHRGRKADPVRSSQRNQTRQGSTSRTIGGSDRIGTEIDTALVNKVSRVLTADKLVTGGLSAQEFATIDQSDSSVPSGAEQSGAPTVSSSPPRVTVGNGRRVLALNDQPAEPQVDSGVGTVPVAAPVGTLPTEVIATPPGRSWVDRLSLPHVRASLPAQPTDPILGLTGLLMICATGAFLGYRQAQATKWTGALARP